MKVLMIFSIGSLLTFLLIFGIDSSFGAELTEEVPKSQYGAPWVVVKCTEEVEKWCRNHSKTVSSQPFNA